MSHRKKILIAAVFCFLCILAGCDDDDDKTRIRGIASIHEAIEGASVQIYNRDAKSVLSEAAQTNENGAFAASVSEAYTDHLKIEVSGGKFAESGEPFTGKLYYIATNHDGDEHSFYHVGPFSTITACYALNNPTKSLEDCYSDVRNYFGIKTSFDNQNDLYYYDGYINPIDFWSETQAYGGAKAFCEVLAADIADPDNNGPQSYFPADQLPNDATSTADAAVFIGKAIAKGALSKAGSDAMGWILESKNDDLEKTEYELDTIISNQKQILDLLDMNAFQDKVDKITNKTDYFENKTEKLHYFTMNPGGIDKEGFLDELERWDISVDLDTVHNNLMGIAPDTSNLFDMYDNKKTNGRSYYANIEKFMQYWAYHQERGLLLFVEKAHGKGSTAADIHFTVQRYAQHINDQSDKFLKLVEQNISIPGAYLDGFSDKNICNNCTGKDYPPHYYGYDSKNDAKRNQWIENNWSFFPDACYKDTTHDDCEGLPTGDVICKRYLKRETSEYYKTSKSTYHLNVNSDLARADDLVFQMRISNDPDSIKIQDGKLTSIATSSTLTMRGMVTPLWYTNFTTGMWSSLNWKMPSLILTNMQTRKEYTIPPATHTVTVPKGYYKEIPSWGRKTEMARYTAKDLPFGNYKVNVEQMNKEYSVNITYPMNQTFPCISHYYTNTAVNFQTNETDQGVIFIFYEPDRDFSTVNPCQ